MEFVQNFPFSAIMLSMLAAIITSALKGSAARRLSYLLCAVNVGLMAALVVFLARTGESYVYRMGHFPAPWGNELRAGLLEGVMALVFSVVMLLSILGGEKHIRLDITPGKVNLYYVMVDLLMGALLALVFTNDIFTAYVFIEISTIASCGLLMIREIGRTTLAATRYMIYSLLGSGLLLIGIVLLYDMTGHLLMSNMQEAIRLLAQDEANRIPLIVATGLMTMGLALKSGLFPFYFWMPDTYGISTPASGAILSGLVSKGYIFILIKIFYRVIGIDYIRESKILNVLFVFGLCAIIVGSLGAIRENDIRRMIAYSSAAQIGYIYAGIGLGTAAGMTAAIFHIAVHAVVKPLLFLSASGLSDASGMSKKFADLQGAGFRNRTAGIAFTAGALSMVGFPMLAGFVTKLLFAMSSVQNTNKMLPMLIVLAISTVLNAVYFLRTVIRIYRPQSIPLPASGEAAAPSVSMIAALACFVALNLVLGLMSAPIAEAIETGLAIFA